MQDSDPDDEYHQEIFQWIQFKERSMHQVQLISPQMCKRRQLVEWTAGVVAKLELTTHTLHTAVRYMDLFMDGHDIEDPQLYLVAICSLLLAAKICEKETCIPRLSVLVTMLPGYGTRNQLNVPELYTLELVMLSYLNWDLNHPTCSYVIELLLQYSISVPDIKFLMKINVTHSFNEIKFWFSKTIKELMDICLSEETMIQTLPSFMAIAILQAWLWLYILEGDQSSLLIVDDQSQALKHLVRVYLQASRSVIGLPWSDQLDMVTGYLRPDYAYLTDCLLSLHKLQNEEENHVQDEGYISTNSSLNVTSTTPE